MSLVCLVFYPGCTDGSDRYSLTPEGEGATTADSIQIANGSGA